MLIVYSLADLSFNAARGFVGGAANIYFEDEVFNLDVSMPHAALWVVQRRPHLL